MALNGHATYTAWTVIAASLNLTHTMVYSMGVDMGVACFFALGLILFLFASYFVLESVFYDKYFRFVITPFLGTHGFEC